MEQGLLLWVIIPCSVDVLHQVVDGHLRMEGKSSGLSIKFPDIHSQLWCTILWIVNFCSTSQVKIGIVYFYFVIDVENFYVAVWACGMICQMLNGTLKYKQRLN
jgi:hypothetical protein